MLDHRPYPNPDINAESGPLIEVKVGSPVFTKDYQRVGTVKEIADGAFKVEVPFWRDYWLTGSTIRVVADDGAVMLRLEKGELADYKFKVPMLTAPRERGRR